MTYDDVLRDYRAGEVTRLELLHAALADLRLANVHIRMGVLEVREAIGDLADYHRVVPGSRPGNDRGCRVALVLRTWGRPPPGGWLGARGSWRRLLELETLLESESCVLGEELAEDLRASVPAVRVWATAVADSRNEAALLASALSDPDDEVRLIAASALLDRGLCDREVRETLTALIAAPRCSDEAVTLIARLAEPASLAPLLQRYRDGARGPVVRALRFVEALPILRIELVDHACTDAAAAVVALGARAAPLVPSIVARLELLAAVAPVPRTWLPGHQSWEQPDLYESGLLFRALAALGPATGSVCSLLLGWAGRPTPVHVTLSFEHQAAGAAGAVCAEAREEFATWLTRPDPTMRRRALHGLAAGGRASERWRPAIEALLQEEDDTAVDAAITLAKLGDIRGARDAWLDFEAWPLMHHGTYPGLHRLADLLIRELPGAVDLADPEDVARSVRALETLGLRSRVAWSSVVFVLGDEDAMARSAAARALETLKGLLAAPPGPA